jgi:hypothetical protein
MNGMKGNAIADVGYSCEQRELIRGWRTAWSDDEPRKKKRGQTKKKNPQQER